MTTDLTCYSATERDRHVERLDDETLVYDTATDHVLRLAPDATAVWDACVGGASASAIVDRTGLGEARVDQALAELLANELVEATDGGLTRRSFAAKAGLGVAAVAGVALVSSMTAPTAASAESLPNGGGSGGNN